MLERRPKVDQRDANEREGQQEMDQDTMEKELNCVYLLMRLVMDLKMEMHLVFTWYMVGQQQMLSVLQVHKH